MVDDVKRVEYAILAFRGTQQALNLCADAFVAEGKCWPPIIASFLFDCGFCARVDIDEIGN